MANSNIINAVFGSGLCAVTTSAYRANYGMKLRFSGIELPTAFECDFSNYDTSNNDSITAIGQNGEVQIPDQLWDSGLNIYAYVYLHPTDDSGVTVYTVTIPVLGRPNRTEEQPTPHEQSVIEQAISALNDAVEQTAADVASADASAQAAAQSEANASVSERSAAASASAALASQNAAESASQSATEQASASAESARNAANSASTAAEAATNAQASAEQAEQSAQSISGDVERAESAAATATEKATEAASSASTASGKATESAQSASSASVSAQNAAESATSAESSATDAEQAKTDAQDAQAAAEQAAESVSGLSAQIAQNTADIADLVQSKAGALIDTASGSIASFVPDSTVPTVKGLTVNVEPIQDLHGYDAPWPSGGGKNKCIMTGRGYISGNNYTVDGNSESMLFYAVEGETYHVSASVSLQRSQLGLLSNGNDISVSQPLSQKVAIDGTYTWTATWTGYTVWYVYTTKNTSVESSAQIELGSTATAYAPYSNICPISGWDSVEVQRTGKNLFPYKDVESQTKNGITFTVEKSNGVITNIHMQGTATGNVSFSFYSHNVDEPWVLPKGNFKLYIGGDKPTQNNTFDVNVRKAGTTSDIVAAFYETTISLSEQTAFGSAYIWIYSGAVLNHNIIPVIVQDGADTSVKYPITQRQSITIDLDQTVYGGTVDAVKGVLTVDRAMVDFGTLNWYTYGATSDYDRYITNGIDSLAKANCDCLCSMFACKAQSQGAVANNVWVGGGMAKLSVTTSKGAYSNVSAFQTAMNGVQLVYELKTPITINLTPLEISVLTGQTNNVWADSGDVSVEYAADLKTYINNKIAAAVAALS